MALKSPPPESFGIRRRLVAESQLPLLDRFVEMQLDGSLPGDAQPRRSMHVTISPKRRMEAQLKRGIVAGYELGQALPATRREIGDIAAPNLSARLGRVTILKNRLVAFRVESEELDNEILTAKLALAKLGLKGMLREPTPTHATIAEANGLLSNRQQGHIKAVLNDVMPIGEMIDLHDMEFYPRIDHTR